MNELTTEQYEQLPEFVKDDFVLDGEVYKHAGVLKMKGTLDGMNGRLSDFEKQREADRLEEEVKIEAARAEAYEKAKKENNVEDILRIEREKLDDEKRRIDETTKQFNDRMEGVAKTQEINIAKSIASDISTKSGRLAFEKLISPYIQVDAMTGQETYLNEDGSASSLNREQFISELKKNEVFAPLVKADIHASGGGDMSGSDGVSTDGRKFNEYNGQELVALKREKPELYNKLRTEYYN